MIHRFRFMNSTIPMLGPSSSLCSSSGITWLWSSLVNQKWYFAVASSWKPDECRVSDYWCADLTIRIFITDWWLIYIIYWETVINRTACMRHPQHQNAICYGLGVSGMLRNQTWLTWWVSWYLWRIIPIPQWRYSRLWNHEIYRYSILISTSLCISGHWWNRRGRRWWTGSLWCDLRLRGPYLRNHLHRPC